MGSVALSDPQVINTLRTKAERIAAHIVSLEAEINQARASLAHVNATIVLFEAPDAQSKQPALMDLNRLFKRREVTTLCKEALADGPMNTRELALWIIRNKGFDENDRHIKKAVAFRVVQSLSLQEKRGGPIKRVGKNANVVIWHNCS